MHNMYEQLIIRLLLYYSLLLSNFHILENNKDLISPTFFRATIYCNQWNPICWDFMKKQVIEWAREKKHTTLANTTKKREFILENRTEIYSIYVANSLGRRCSSFVTSNTEVAAVGLLHPRLGSSVIKILASGVSFHATIEIYYSPSWGFNFPVMRNQLGSSCPSSNFSPLQPHRPTT